MIRLLLQSEKLFVSQIFGLLLTTPFDTNGHWIVNLLVGVLTHDTPYQPYLSAYKELPKTNHSTVSWQLKNMACMGCDKNLYLFLSNPASYMVKTRDSLKFFTPISFI